MLKLKKNLNIRDNIKNELTDIIQLDEYQIKKNDNLDCIDENLFDVIIDFKKNINLKDKNIKSIKLLFDDEIKPIVIGEEEYNWKSRYEIQIMGSPIYNNFINKNKEILPNKFLLLGQFLPYASIELVLIGIVNPDDFMEKIKIQITTFDIDEYIVALCCCTGISINQQIDKNTFIIKSGMGGLKFNYDHNLWMD